LQKSLKEVDGSFRRGEFISYTLLRRLFAKLDTKEKNQLVDYIIKKYSVIRYDVLVTKCYDGYSNMLTAINSNTGSEYDINECRWGRSDAEYRELYRFMYNQGYSSAGDILSLDVETKIKLHNDMVRLTRATSQQICKFLHLKIVQKPQ
jgi:DNA-binding CsgD family transcriptional regulator